MEAIYLQQGRAFPVVGPARRVMRLVAQLGLDRADKTAPLRTVCLASPVGSPPGSPIPASGPPK